MTSRRVPCKYFAQRCGAWAISRIALDTATRNSDDVGRSRARYQRTASSEFFPRLGVKSKGTYSPSGNSSASSRSTCSPGMVFTRPERMSSTRRLISSSQAASTPSSAGSRQDFPPNDQSAARAPAVESLSAFSRISETCGVICAILTSLPMHLTPARKRPMPKIPFSFQQLTSTQSPISPLNPIFPPFVGIKMRISLPSNNMTIRPIPREKCTNSCTNQVQFPGRATSNGFCGLGSQVKPRQVLPEFS